MNSADGNFINPFRFTKIADTNIILGSYPSEELDIHRLSEARVTDVISLLNADDIRQREVRNDKLMHFYRSKGIKTIISCPVSDANESAYCKSAFEAAQKLNELVNIQ